MVIIQNLSQFQQSAGYIGRQASCFFSQVEPMRINFRFETPIIQVHVQIIIYIID